MVLRRKWRNGKKWKMEAAVPRMEIVGLGDAGDRSEFCVKPK